MRPLTHPSVDDITVEGILHALSDPVRVHILAGIVKAECPQCCAKYQRLENRELPKSTLSQHFKVLREAGLIRSERKGVEMHNITRYAELEERFGPLLNAILDAYAAQRQLAPPNRKPA